MDAYKVTMSLVVEADSPLDAMSVASMLMSAKTLGSVHVDHMRVTVEGSPLNGRGSGRSYPRKVKASYGREAPR